MTDGLEEISTKKLYVRLEAEYDEWSADDDDTFDHEHADSQFPGVIVE